MPSYDMNKKQENYLSVNLLKRKNEKRSAKFSTFNLNKFAHDNKIEELCDILSDVQIYFDFNDAKKIAAIEIITWYDD
jgi:hypothetical protein